MKEDTNDQEIERTLLNKAEDKTSGMLGLIIVSALICILIFDYTSHYTDREFSFSAPGNLLSDNNAFNYAVFFRKTKTSNLR